MTPQEAAQAIPSELDNGYAMADTRLQIIMNPAAVMEALPGPDVDAWALIDAHRALSLVIPC